MPRRITLVILSVSFCVFACADKKDAATQTSPAPTREAETLPTEQEPIAQGQPGPVETRSCKEQAAELRSFLTRVFDKDAEVEAPWPTGDAEVDAWIEEARAKLREMTKPADPAKRQMELSEGVDTSADEEMYRDCPEGLAAVQAVGTAEPAKRTEAFIKIADAVEACDCKVKIGQLKASYYMGQRGPD